jgi:hypothetical protein
LEIFTGTGDAIRFLAGGKTGTERARIDSSGRLLVGTSTARALVIGGNSTNWPGRVQSSTTSIGTGIGFTAISWSDYATDLGGGGGTSDIVLARSNSNTEGTQAAVTNGMLLGRINFNGSDGTAFANGAYIAAASDGQTWASGDCPARLVFSTTADGASSPTERMRISSNGHTYWGTSAPSASAYGTSIGRLGLAGFFETSRNVDGSSEVAYFFGNAGRMQIKGDGDLENTNNSYGAISDLKLKENVIDATSQWNDIKALQVRKYNFKNDTGFNTHTQIGLVAQEVELVSPGLVSESPDRDEDGNDLNTVTKSVNYSVLYMKAVKALQEAMERIETLEAKVAALEAQ